MNERRLGIVRIEPQTIIDALKGQHVISGDLPHDARVVGVDYDVAVGGFRVLCESASFAPVSPGSTVPIISSMTSAL